MKRDLDRRLLPDVPTMKEAGVDVASDGFLALYGPPGMAPDPVTRLSSAVAEVMRLTDTQERIAALGQQAEACRRFGLPACTPVRTASETAHSIGSHA